MSCEKGRQAARVPVTDPQVAKLCHEVIDTKRREYFNYINPMCSLRDAIPAYITLLLFDSEVIR